MPEGKQELSFPMNSGELVRWLHAAYPQECIKPGQTLEDAHRYAGKRELIDELIDWIREEGLDHLLVETGGRK
jgi:hypothetical protein